MDRRKFDKTSFVHDNRLQVGGRFLWADVLEMPVRNYARRYEKVSAEELEWALRMGRGAIHAAIEDFYSEQYRKLTPQGYTVVRPSIWAAQLGSKSQTEGRDSQVYNPKGYKNGGTHFDKDEQHEIFWPHWEAVERVGFRPNVKKAADDAAWLLLRNDDYRD